MQAVGRIDCAPAQFVVEDDGASPPRALVIDGPGRRRDAEHFFQTKALGGSSFHPAAEGERCNDWAGPGCCIAAFDGVAGA